jgi:hypothetical protein
MVLRVAGWLLRLAAGPALLLTGRASPNPGPDLRFAGRRRHVVTFLGLKCGVSRRVWEGARNFPAGGHDLLVGSLVDPGVEQLLGVPGSLVGFVQDVRCLHIIQVGAAVRQECGQLRL